MAGSSSFRAIHWFFLLWLQQAVGTRLQVMPWFCLERCNGTNATISEGLQQIKAHKDLIQKAAFEKYNLGANGSLVNNPSLYNVASALQAAGLQTYPMVSSYPYPPQFLDWMRQLFDPTKPYGDTFIESLKAEAVQNGFTGFNIDWEPQHGTPTPEDATNYARYLNKMAEELAAIDVKVTVDIATWSTIWNWTELASTKLHRVIMMSTYTNDLNSFESVLQKSVAIIGIDKLGVGLSVNNLVTKKPFTASEIQKRLALVHSYGVQEVDIWKMPLVDFWFDLL